MLTCSPPRDRTDGRASGTRASGAGVCWLRGASSYDLEWSPLTFGDCHRLSVLDLSVRLLWAKLPLLGNTPCAPLTVQAVVPHPPPPVLPYLLPCHSARGMLPKAPQGLESEWRAPRACLPDSAQRCRARG